MEPEQRRWLVVNAIVVTAAINVVLNALPAWLAVRGVDHVPLWTIPLSGGTGLVTDTLGTLIVLPFVTTILCTTAVWYERRRGRLPRLSRLPDRIAILAMLPARRLPRAAALALITVWILAVPAALALAVFAPRGLGHDPFIAYKTGLGVVLGLVVTPLIALRAMSDRAVEP